MCRQEIENLQVEKSNEIHIMNHRKDLKKSLFIKISFSNVLIEIKKSRLAKQLY